MKIARFTCWIGSLLLIGSGLVPVRLAGDEPKGLGTIAPAWSLNDVDGHTVRSVDFKNQVLVVDFWATWCGPCRQEIPGYVALQKKYAARGVVIVGISLDQLPPTALKEFIRKNGLNYLVVLGDEAVANAFGGVNAIPTTFIVGRDGKVAFSKVGAMPEAEFEKALQKAL